MVNIPIKFQDFNLNFDWILVEFCSPKQNKITEIWPKLTKQKQNPKG
jgi:hypothetical protein